jgi:hypothetical protein
MYYPPGTGSAVAPDYTIEPGVPAPVAPPLTDTSLIPPFEPTGPVAPPPYGGGDADDWQDLPPGVSTDYVGPPSLQAPGTRLPQQRGMSTTGMVVLIAAGAGLLYFIAKKKGKK